MTDQTTRHQSEPAPAATPSAARADTAMPARMAATGADDASAQGREWLAQLETMINDIATQAAPVARQVGAKAAELAAVAAIKAGPIAQRGRRGDDRRQPEARRAREQPRRGAAGRDPGDACGRTSRGRMPPTPTPATGTDAPPPAATFEDATLAEDQPRAGGTIEPHATARQRPPSPSRDRAVCRVYSAVMSVRPIVLLGDPRLRLKGETVDSFGKLPPRAARRPDRLDAPRAGRRARGAAAGRAAAGLRDRGRGPPVRARQPARSCAPTATTATSRAASRSRATSPTSPATRRSGSSPRTGAARRSRSRAPGCSAGAPARAGPPRRQAVHRLPRLDGRADRRRAAATTRTRRRRSRCERSRERPCPPPDDGRVRTVFLGSARSPSRPSSALAAHPLVRHGARGDRRAASAPAVGRSWTVTPVERAARALGLEPVLTPPRLRHPDAVATILALRPDLAVLADYGQIVPPPLLDLPHGALNLHPSALPRFRGAAPVPAAILAGDPATAVTLMRMDAGLDTGPIVAQAAVALDGTETAPELEARLAGLARGPAGPVARPVARRRAARRAPAAKRRRPHPAAPPRGRTPRPTRPAAELERAVRAYAAVARARSSSSPGGGSS